MSESKLVCCSSCLQRFLIFEKDRWTFLNNSTNIGLFVDAGMPRSLVWLEIGLLNHLDSFRKGNKGITLQPSQCSNRWLLFSSDPSLSLSFRITTINSSSQRCGGHMWTSFSGSLVLLQEQSGARLPLRDAFPRFPSRPKTSEDHLKWIHTYVFIAKVCKSMQGFFLPRQVVSVIVWRRFIWMGCYPENPASFIFSMFTLIGIFVSTRNYGVSSWKQIYCLRQ